MNIVTFSEQTVSDYRVTFCFYSSSYSRIETLGSFTRFYGFYFENIETHF